MIQDPEKDPERWDEPIVADNPRQAKQDWEYVTFVLSNYTHAACL